MATSRKLCLASCENDKIRIFTFSGGDRMNEEIVFRQWKTWRGMIIKLRDHVSEEEADQMPPPFRNSIRWNAGHLAAVIDIFVSKSLDTKPFLPERYQTLFASCTSPQN